MDARDEAELDVGRLGEVELLDLLAGHRDELVVVHVPELVALEAEVLHADRGVGARSGTIHGLQDLKFWIRSTCTPG